MKHFIYHFTEQLMVWHHSFFLLKINKEKKGKMFRIHWSLSHSFEYGDLASWLGWNTLLVSRTLTCLDWQSTIITHLSPWNWKRPVSSLLHGLVDTVDCKIGFLGFADSWLLYSSQSFTISLIYLKIPGQNIDCLAKRMHLAPPWCPVRKASKTSRRPSCLLSK